MRRTQPGTSRMTRRPSQGTPSSTQRHGDRAGVADTGREPGERRAQDLGRHRRPHAARRLQHPQQLAGNLARHPARPPAVSQEPFTRNWPHSSSSEEAWSTAMMPTTSSASTPGPPSSASAPPADTAAREAVPGHRGRARDSNREETATGKRQQGRAHGARSTCGQAGAARPPACGRCATGTQPWRPPARHLLDMRR
jgi:hypothetical protein